MGAGGDIVIYVYTLLHVGTHGVVVVVVVVVMVVLLNVVRLTVGLTVWLTVRALHCAAQSVQQSP